MDSTIQRTRGVDLSFNGILDRFGPAWIISAVAAGPATMASVAIAGGLYGYQVLWVVVLSALLAFIAQYMAAKVGVIGGKGIVGLVEDLWGETWAWILMIDALLATWLAAAVLMKSLVEATNLITGVATPWWSAGYAVLLFLLVGFGGYKVLEKACKLMVAFVVICFLVTVVKVGPDPSALLRGLVPSFPGGGEGALMTAGIMGGAVHITIIAMHTYNVNARGWSATDIPLARLDTFLSMFVAFGLYSCAIYVSAATVLHPEGVRIKNVFDLASVLKPVLGPHAGAVFLAGLWGAVISTISPTFLAGGYLLADKLKWELSVKDRRFRAAVAAGILTSLIGPFYPGSFLVLLVVMLALGLCGTPLIIAMLMILLNKKEWAGENRNGRLLNVFGLATLLITSGLALRFILTRLGLW